MIFMPTIAGNRKNYALKGNGINKPGEKGKLYAVVFLRGGF